MEKKLGLGTQSHLYYVRIGSVLGGARVACQVGKDSGDFCELVVCANHFVCVELVGV